jgi:hypothetical protein
MKVIFCGLILAFSLILSHNNADLGKYKLWDPNNKLVWSDFKDTLVTNSHRAAATNSGIKSDFTQTDQNSLTVNAFSAMFAVGSWVDSTRKTDHVLLHEQYHFNITEYWCRKLKKDLATAHLTTKNFKDKIQSIQKQNMMDSHEMQVEYDKETNHSEIFDEQARWEKKVDELLKSVEEYAPTSVQIKLH